MSFYHRLGEIPHKRHTQFRKPDGGLYREEVMGLEGFSGIQSILYHHFLPPRVLEVEDMGLELHHILIFVVELPGILGEGDLPCLTCR